MDEIKLSKALKDPVFVSQFVSAKSRSELYELFSKYRIHIKEKELLELQSTIETIRQDVINSKKLDNQELDEISGGKFKIGRYIGKTCYYTGYGPGYVTGKIPVVGETVYKSIRDAIRGFYESWHNY